MGRLHTVQTNMTDQTKTLTTSYELTQFEVDSILNLIAREGVRIAEGGETQQIALFALRFTPIIQKLDPKGWDAAQAEAHPTH